MTIYEMPVLLRVMKRSETVETLKRIANAIFETGGYIRKMENWGEKELPCKASCHGQVFRQASHFFFCFDVPPASLKELSDGYGRDIDIIRSRIYKQNPCDTGKTCTLEEELLPPAYRPSVLTLLELAKKQKNNKHQFKYNSGLNYYPFAR